MHWIHAGLISAALLGLYDLFKKSAVKENAVLPVLFFSSLTSCLIWLPFTLLSASPLASGLPETLQVSTLSLHQHLLVGLKAAIVSASWICSYFALKHLPISIASPIRSTGPLWTLTAALWFFGEQPDLKQLAGITLALLSFIAFSLAGRKEGIRFERNPWVLLMIAGTLIGSASALFDKHLFTSLQMPVNATQAWFSIYLSLLLAIPAWGWKQRWWPRAEFHWRASIPAIGIFLLLADYAYFQALRDPDALISVLSSLRRSNVLITFTVGSLLFRESGFWTKLPCVAGLLCGVILILI
jgi:drug/metabolite transporter (DMT)-like permease